MLYRKLLMAAVRPWYLRRRLFFYKDCITCNGKTTGENICGKEIKDYTVIRSIENPYSKEGGIAVLKGNLDPDGCVVKRAAVAELVLDEELESRREAWVPFEIKVKKGYLARYSKLVTSGCKGAILE